MAFANLKRVWVHLLAAVAVSDFAGAAADPAAMGSKEANKSTEAAVSAAPLAEVVVTGTNIRGGDIAPVVNIQTIDREQLERTGATRMADLTSQIPANTGTTQYNENGQLSGTAQFELRGLGFSSTLVLLNGRRAGVAPLSDKSGADFVDINQFPLSMVGRLDVLKDGASAIYGSEAVAGVVNIITRKGFDGLELTGDYASSTNDAWSMNLASGHKFDKGSVNFYATYYHQTGNLRSDFPWLIARVGGNGTLGYSQLINNNGFPASYQLATLNPAGRAQAVAGAPLAADPNCVAAGGVFPINAAGVANTSSCDFNFANQIGVIPSERRIQAFLEGNYDITGNLSYFNETSVSRNINRVYEQAPGFSNGAAVGGLTYVPASAPFNFFVADPASPKNIIAVDPAQWNPAVDHAVPIVGSFRPQGRYSSAYKEQTNTYLRAVNGLDLTLAHDWHASLSHEYAHAQYQELNPLAENAAALNDLIATGQYNPFGSAIVTPNLVSPKDGVSVAGNSQANIARIFYTSDLTRTTEQNVVELSASGPVLSLPSGPVSVAVGGQYRSQSLNYVPDSLTAQGLGSTSTLDAPFAASERVWAEYVEAIVPFYERARVQVAVRHENYGGAVGSTTDPKITAHLDLVPKLLGLRGSWGTSFQAPTLTQGSTTQVLTIVNDPAVLGPNGYTCTSSLVGFGANVITSGGNLTPQRSKNYDLGLELKPSTTLTVDADYWHYDYRNLIAAGQNAQTIVSGECVNGRFVADPRVVRAASGLLDTVNTAFVNVGKVIADGVDLSLTYDLSLEQLGNLLFRADATHVDHFKVYGAKGLIADDAGSRNFNNNFAPMPKWRGNAHALWSRGIHEITLGVNFTGGYRNDQDFNAPIDSFTTVDVQYALHFERLLREKSNSTILSIGANNVGNTPPPALTRYTAAGALVAGPLAVDRPGYDALSGANIQGRIIYVRFKQTF